MKAEWLCSIILPIWIKRLYKIYIKFDKILPQKNLSNRLTCLNLTSINIYIIWNKIQNTYRHGTPSDQSKHRHALSFVFLTQGSEDHEGSPLCEQTYGLAVPGVVQENWWHFWKEWQRRTICVYKRSPPIKDNPVPEKTMAVEFFFCFAFNIQASKVWT